MLVVLAAAATLVASGCTTVVRSSVSSDGVAANGQAVQRTGRSISDDGRYVIFSSSATNLIPFDTNQSQDVFRHDNLTGETIRVSVTNRGDQISGTSTELAISASGDAIVFSSSAQVNPGEAIGSEDVYVHTVSTGDTERVSVNADGTPIIGTADAGSFTSASISDDGNLVLMVQAFPGSGGIYLRNRSAGTTAPVGGGFEPIAILSGDGHTMVETAPCAGPSGDCTNRSFVSAPESGASSTVIDTQCGFVAYDITANGRYVVGQRLAVPPTYSCAGPTGLVRWDRTTGAFTPAPLSIGIHPMISISNDGRFVASTGQDLVARIVDLTTGGVEYPDTDAWSTRGAGPSFGIALSGDGRTVAFQTNSKLDSGDTNIDDDVYARYSIQPLPSAVTPASAARGLTHAVVMISGVEFLPGATVSMGTGITVNSVALLSPSSLQANISIDAGATIGPRNVIVSNTGGIGHSDGWCTACLTVS